MSWLVLPIAILLPCALANGPGYALPDSNEARYVFYLADKNHDYRLDKPEFHQVFYDFDRNHDGDVTSDEFLVDWQERNLGTAVDAIVLFTHLDVDRNGVIHDFDLPWIEGFFDRDNDGHVGQAEFVTQWIKMLATHIN